MSDTKNSVPDNKDCETCPICLLAIVNDKVITCCGHIFHDSCLDIWYKTHSTCPICRRKSRQEIPVLKSDGLSFFESFEPYSFQ